MARRILAHRTGAYSTLERLFAGVGMMGQSFGPGGGGCSEGECKTMEVPWWEWMLFRLALYLITAPAVAVTVYLIFRKRGP
jgi:hypothetical protein